MASTAYIDKPTKTLAQLKASIDMAIELFGPNYPVRVNSTYDQGCSGMPITDVTISGDDGYVGIEA